MNMQNYYGVCWKKFADFRGRACRKEFWSFVLVNFIIGVALEMYQKSTGYKIITDLFSLLILVPSLSVACRRLHDIDKSGWWQLLWTCPFAVCFIVLIAVVFFPGLAMALFLILSVIFIAALFCMVAMMVRKGTDGGNQYGPDPLAEKER